MSNAMPTSSATVPSAQPSLMPMQLDAPAAMLMPMTTPSSVTLAGPSVNNYVAANSSQPQTWLSPNNNNNQVSTTSAAKKQKTTTSKAGGKCARYWAFTINNAEHESYDFEKREEPEWYLPKLKPTEDNHLVYAIYSEEQGENGVDHLQGMAQFSQPVRMSHVKSIHPLMARAHVEPMLAKSCPAKLREYCKKEGAHEIGEWTYPFLPLIFNEN